MTIDEFKACATAIAARKAWTVDIEASADYVEAWFCDPALNGADTAQAYMYVGEAPVGLDGF